MLVLWSDLLDVLGAKPEDPVMPTGHPPAAEAASRAAASPGSGGRRPHVADQKLRAAPSAGSDEPAVELGPVDDIVGPRSASA